jgi:hypothetical protein
MMFDKNLYDRIEAVFKNTVFKISYDTYMDCVIITDEEGWYFRFFDSEFKAEELRSQLNKSISDTHIIRDKKLFDDYSTLNKLLESVLDRKKKISNILNFID